MPIKVSFLSMSVAKIAGCVFALALLIPVFGEAQEYTFERTWGIGGFGGEEFAQPDGVTVDDTGDVFVTDVTQDRILMFNADGAFRLSWGGASLGPDAEFALPFPHTDPSFSIPEGIGVEGGVVYVADTGYHRIQKFISPQISDAFPNSGPPPVVVIWGSFGSDLELFNAPVDIEVDDSGGVYVVDSLNHRIQKFNALGFFLTRWGTNGTGAGEFSSPGGIAVDPDFNSPGGGVYVVDTGNDRVQKFDSTGTFILTWGSTGTGDGEFMSPEGIAVDADGNTFVADTGNHRIQKFDSEGKFITSWGGFGTALGEFDTPLDVAVNSQGDVYVSDSGNLRMQKFNPPGNVGDGTDPGTAAAPDLLENFTILDTDFDGFLSLIEAQVLFPGLTQISFDEMDSDGDNLLSEAELTFADGGDGGDGGGDGDGGGIGIAGSGGSGGSCFIATAAYGSPIAEEINVLREVRDAYLLNNFAGSVFVDTYYRLSPMLADNVAESPMLAAVIRAIMAPVLFFSKLILSAPLTALAIVVSLFAASLVSYRRRRFLLAKRG